ncbi:MAG: PEGA domain-containing protein [Phycisphaerales bacterium]
MRSLAISSALAFGALTGCVERTISITSEPEGALVYLNDREIGRTPVEVEFLYYGTYDIRLVKDGYEPFVGAAKAEIPLYDQPGIDLVAEALPINFEKRVEWHFELEPAAAEIDPMIDRARDLRSRLDPAETGSDPATDANESVSDPALDDSGATDADGNEANSARSSEED